MNILGYRDAMCVSANGWEPVRRTAAVGYTVYVAATERRRQKKVYSVHMKCDIRVQCARAQGLISTRWCGGYYTNATTSRYRVTTLKVLCR